jgi:hypothetical protein
MASSSESLSAAAPFETNFSRGLSSTAQFFIEPDNLLKVSIIAG